MKKQDIYQRLEEKMLGYSDYINIPVAPIDEPLVPITPTANLAARQGDTAMYTYTGKDVYVRQGVLERLERASHFLKDEDSTLQLEVGYGYRALKIQRQLFEKYKAELSETYRGEELIAATHRLVAVPEAAGHPAGAAVDIQIIQNGKPLNFGTKMWEFIPDTFTFSPFISRQAWQNRQLLRRVLLAVGFAPFDGEWWHFSYGDKEWAKYYNKKAALYEQTDFSIKRDDLV
jgi:D-alanyl-D-alanine dipeptidase